MVQKVTCSMIPAIATQLTDSGVEDIGSVPVISVDLIGTSGSLSCVGVIDTGADISVLDEGAFRELGGQPSSFIHVRVAGFSDRVAPIVRLTVRVRGETRGEEMVFDGVPVAVFKLERPGPMLLIGRRGILEQIRMDLDFPRKKIVLYRSGHQSHRYPNLSREFRTLTVILEDIDNDREVEAIMQMGWEMEQFLDRAIAEERTKRRIAVTSARESRTIADKFKIFENRPSFAGIREAVREFLDIRNRAAHSINFAAPGKTKTEALVRAAEEIVSWVRTGLNEGSGG